ncbi:hypothetical protein GCM10009827_018700 [Dactylosporangium maewongense]|uniref:Uncharacterized protein n=1 Tax=Dactylosporangium maewongense TaxID=634393 RepID=A0ABN1ZVF2_9ACTN
MGGEAAGGGDAVDADDGHLEVESVQGAVGDGADELVGLGAGDAAGHDQLQPGAQRQLGGDVDGVGDDGEVDAGRQEPGEQVGGGAAGEAQGERAVREQLERALRDAGLGLAVLAGAVADRELGEGRGRGDRAPVGAGEELLVLERLQVATDRGGGDAELRGEGAGVDGAAARDAGQDRRDAVGAAAAHPITEQNAQFRMSTCARYLVKRTGNAQPWLA